MSEVVVTGRTYKLRAGAPMPVGRSSFILQTFMGEESTVTTYLYTENLPDSAEFRGQGGELVSGSFNRMMDISGDAFTGNTVTNPEFVEERV
jgi:hypothetical protein